MNDMVMNNCSRCGGAGVIKCLYHERRFLFYAHCVKCGMDTPNGETIEEAKEKWNETSASSKISSKGVEALETTLENQVSEAQKLLESIQGLNITSE